MAARVVGTEGLYARELVLQKRMRALGWRVLAVTPALLAVVAVLCGQPLAAVVLLAVEVLAAPRLWARARRETRSLSRTRVGAVGEQQVVQALRGMPGVHAVLSGRNVNSRSREDVDQIVLMDTGAVVAVEVKYKRRAVRWDATHGDLVDSKGEPVKGRPVAQVTRGAQHLVSALDGLLVGPVGRIVCLPDSALRSPLVVSDGVQVGALKHLPEMLAGQGETVDLADLSRAVRAIQQAHGGGRR